MTLGFLSLGTVVDLWDADYPGFVYAQHKVVTPLLGDGTAGAGFSVVQETAKGLRNTTLSFVTESTADKDVIRGYEEDGTEVTFVDYDGTERLVHVLSFRSEPGPTADLWRVSVVLEEIGGSAPAALASATAAAYDATVVTG
jgi:hypothetical protein